MKSRCRHHLGCEGLVSEDRWLMPLEWLRPLRPPKEWGEILKLDDLKASSPSFEELDSSCKGWLFGCDRLTTAKV